MLYIEMKENLARNRKKNVEFIKSLIHWRTTFLSLWARSRLRGFHIVVCNPHTYLYKEYF